MRQSVLSANLANANTTGFKRDLIAVQSRANAVDEDPTLAGYRTPITENQGGGVFPSNLGIDLTQSSLQKTGNPTDLALDGSGFFVVQGEKPGEKSLTRDGRFLVRDDGTLVMATSGRPVLSASGEQIHLSPDASRTIAIDPRGNLTQQGGGSAQIGLTGVSDPTKLMKLGGNLMGVSDPKVLTDINPGTVVRQGNLEQSGVDPIVEMVNMMEGQRAFDANAKMITFQDQTLSQLNTIGKVA